MKTTHRLLVLALAIAVNAAALATVHIAMVQGVQRALAANEDPEHVVVTATRSHPELARSNCPAASKAL
jgi:hypothetical protein